MFGVILAENQCTFEPSSSSFQPHSTGEKSKHSQEKQESGRVQQILDDMNYLIDGLSESNNTDTRCLR